ncbi:N-acetylglucosamine-6-phosphate deacetylase [Microbacterium excoecariae]|uniref:N-acetylglucosamine-6-phosphate deacetylase n=1 Tax=Microbacterium excoecariae TaxID=2715210 RepID=UPI00140E3FDE|nr:N-acetylglucosamine-6-phosphate deacetylase [Microbacterium excoecariae]NHI17354.1 N-acetylglucosamine-6-phosphate deacetylase [Microbacterium excoecariae]
MTLIHSARLVSSGEVIDDGWILMRDGRIAARGAGGTWREEAGPAGRVVDASGLLLAPGFVDIHAHGGGGAHYDGDEAEIRRALETHRAHGTTRHVLSLVTASRQDLAERLGRVASLARADPLVVGAHLEGPFLDAAHKGAHAEHLLRAPTEEEVAALLAEAAGALVQVTLAPELPGAAAAARQLRRAGVRVAVGHTAADFAGAAAAFDAGATILTHAFNAMAGIHHRAPGPVVAALSRPEVTLEIINDGVHVHPAVVRMAFDAAPGRVALVTDAMAAAGAPDGAYRLGELDVEVQGGIARLAGGGAIAGSTLTLDRAIARAVDEVGVGVAEAIRAATEVPARAIGRGDAFGSLEPGFSADAVLLTPGWGVAEVWGDGRVLHAAR